MGALKQITAPGISGVQWARNEKGEDCWYALLDFKGYTFRTDMFPTEEQAQEALECAIG